MSREAMKHTQRPTEEDYLHEQLRMLQISYEKAAKPIIDRLVHIRSFKPSPSIFVDLESLPADMRAMLKAKATGGEV